MEDSVLFILIRIQFFFSGFLVNLNNSQAFVNYAFCLDAIVGIIRPQPQICWD